MLRGDGVDVIVRTALCMTAALPRMGWVNGELLIPLLELVLTVMGAMPLVLLAGRVILRGELMATGWLERGERDSTPEAVATTVVLMGAGNAEISRGDVDKGAPVLTLRGNGGIDTPVLMLRGWLDGVAPLAVRGVTGITAPAAELRGEGGETWLALIPIVGVALFP